jgi:galactokinase
MLADVIDTVPASMLLTRGAVAAPQNEPVSDPRPRTEMFERCRIALGTRRAASFYFVPGRIEVLGKHTDYCGGHSIVAATEQGFCIAALPREDHRINVTALPRKERVQFELDLELQPKAGIWANYPMTVARRIARNFADDEAPPLRGADIAFLSDLAPAAGLSSSSALIIASFLVLADVNDLWHRPQFHQNIRTIEDLAGYLGTIENCQSFFSLFVDSGVGTFGGSEDHTAILGAEASRLKVYSYCPVRIQQTMELPEEYVFAVASSGVIAEKTGAAMEQYNHASVTANRVLELWNRHTSRQDQTLAAAAEHISRDEHRGEAATNFEAYLRQQDGADDLIRRLSHFVLEDLAVRVTSKLLSDGQVERMGGFVDESQRGAEELLGNQTEQTAFLQRAARELGASASSAFGGGFGGSVWALVWSETAPRFLANWAEVYRREWPKYAENAAYFLTRPGRAACRVIM